MPLRIKGRQKVKVRVQLISAADGRARMNVKLETEDYTRDLGEKILDVGDTLQVNYSIDVDERVIVRHH